MLRLVDEVFNHIFADAFEEAGEDEIDTYVYRDQIEDKIGEDSMAGPLKELFDPDTTPTLTS